MMNNIAIIAAGTIGKMYGRLIGRTPGLCLKTVIDKYESRESLAGLGIDAETVTADAAALYEDKSIDKVIVAASTAAHVELCGRLIESGKHVLCEKPVSFDPALIRETGRRADEKKLVFQVGYVRRFDPDYRKLKGLLDEGAAGSIHMVKIINRDPERPRLSFVEKSGGIFIDFLVHDFDMLSYLTGSRVSKIYAEADVKIDPALSRYGDFDTVLLTAKMENGILASIDCSRETGYGYDQRLEVFGSGGCYRVENIPVNRLTAFTPDRVSSALPRWDYQERYKEAFEAQLLGFLESVRLEKAPSVTWEDAARAVETAAACIRSQKEDRPVYLRS